MTVISVFLSLWMHIKFLSYLILQDILLVSLTNNIVHVWLALICLLPSLTAELVRPWRPNQC